MAKFGLLSGRVKVKSGADLSADRNDFLGLDNAEPNLGLPASNNSFAASDTNGTRKFIAPGTGLTVSGGSVNVDETTLVIDTTGYQVTSNTNLADVLSDLDYNVSLKFDAADFTGSNILTQLLTVDGSGSTLDADLLDGQEGSYYLDWTNVTNKPDPQITVELLGKVTGIANTTLTDLASGTISITTELEDTGVTANTYGSASEVPQFTVDSDGRISSVTNVSVAGVDDVTFDANTGVLTVSTSAGTSYNVDLNVGIEDDLTVTSLNTDHIDFTTTSANVAHQEGRLFYSEEYKTLTSYNDISDVALQIGFEEWVRVYNGTGSTITNGTPCRPVGIQGEHQSVAPAIATSVGGARVLGVATHDIPSGTYGILTVRGLLSGIDTSGLTAGQPVYLNETGGLQNSAPTYPYFPTQVGGCIVSDATNGYIYVSISYDTISQLRVTGNSHMDGNLTVDGDLVVSGTQSIVAQNNLAISDSFIYLNSGDNIGPSGTTFTGTGLDDAYFTGYYEGTSTTTYYVRIDGVGTGTGGVDTFEWSKDNFATTEATGVDITGDDQLLDDNISVFFNATTGHTSGDVWSGTAVPLNVDTGWSTNRNTGATGPGYTHMGVFFDVSDEKFKFFDQYAPEPSGTINVNDASFNLATIVAGTFEGALTGNVTGDVSGNAGTATKLLTARTISLTGDVSGSTTFDGSANSSITVNITADTDEIAEGNTNLYYTTTRANTDFDTRLSTKTTTDLTEGTNLYYTDTRVKTVLSTSASDGIAWDGITEALYLTDTGVTANTYGSATDPLEVPNFTVDENGRITAAATQSITKATIDALLIDASTLGAQSGSFYLDYNNFTNTPTIGAGTITVEGGNGLANSGSFGVNDTGATTITIDHGDTSSFANTANSGRTYIQNINVDEFGHIQSVTTGTETVVNTTYTLDGSSQANNTVQLELVGSDVSTDFVEFVGTGSTLVSWDEVNQRIIIDADVDTDQFLDNASFDPDINVLSLGRSGALGDINVDFSGIRPDYQNLTSKPVEWSLKTTRAVSGTGSFAIDAFAVADYTTVKYIIEAVSTATTPNSIQALEVLVVHDGTDVYLTQYGEINTGTTSVLSGVDADILAGQVRLLATDTNLDNVTIRVTRIHV